MTIILIIITVTSLFLLINHKGPTTRPFPPSIKINQRISPQFNIDVHFLLTKREIDA